MHDTEVWPGVPCCLLWQYSSDTFCPGPVFTDHVRGKQLDVLEPRLMQMVRPAEPVAPMPVDGTQDSAVAACGDDQPRLVLRPLGWQMIAVSSSRSDRDAASVVGLKSTHT